MSTAAHAGNHTGIAFERARSPSSATEHEPPQPTHPDDQASRLRALVEAGAFDLAQAEPDTDQDLVIETDEVYLDDDSHNDREVDLHAALQHPVSLPQPQHLAPVTTPSAPALPRLCKRIAVVSGKGGVGKSNVAVNLAIALAATGRRTSLVDADLGTANADVLCGLLPAARLEHALPELDSCDGATRSLQDIAINAPGGFQLIPGSAGLGRIADLDPQHRHRLLTEVETLEPHRDVILIDTSAGIGAPAIMFARWADAVVLVCTPEPTAMADAYAMLKALARSVQDNAHNPGTASLGRRVGIVVNQVPGDDEARAAYRRIAGVCDRFLGFRPVFMGLIPYDREVPASVLARRPLLLNKPRAKAAAHIRQLADRLAEQLPIPFPAQPSTEPNPAQTRQTPGTQGTPIAVDRNADVVVGHQSPPTASARRRSIFSGLLSSLNRRNRCAPVQDLHR